MHGILQVLSGICSETEVSEQLYSFQKIWQKMSHNYDYTQTLSYITVILRRLIQAAKYRIQYRTINF
jgi:hypothetical protein